MQPKCTAPTARGTSPEAAAHILRATRGRGLWRPRHLSLCCPGCTWGETGAFLNFSVLAIYHYVAEIVPGGVRERFCFYFKFFSVLAIYYYVAQVVPGGGEERDVWQRES